MTPERSPGAAPADDYGFVAELRTPCYVYDPEVAIARYRQLKARLGTRLIVSLKANPNQDLLARSAHAYEDGVELASRGELDIVIGRIKAPRYLNNPSMDETLMRAGLASRCHFVLDNLDAVARFVPLAREARAGGAEVGRLLLRLNAGALAGAHSRANWHDHFGMTPNEAHQAVLALKAAGLPVAGLHVFSGPHSFARASAAAPDTLGLPDALAALARDLAGANGAALESLSLGGGFAEDAASHDASEANEADNANPADGAARPASGAGEDRHAEAFARYREAIAPLAGNWSLAHESGRAIFADCGLFVTRVVAVKHWADRSIAVCDGGLSHAFLLAQTEAVMKKLAAPVLVRQGRGSDGSGGGKPRGVPTFYVGSTCSRADVIGRDDHGTPPVPGDLAVFPRCGAYHRSYSMAHFLSHDAAHVYVRAA
ncbi:PLP-dependent decarboxylase [Burkholderia sp. Cy-637]|uniref:PLP-dependent decarboxylase n=1 Tax=Burkholderia sp. Cy-637 TaxID=2608327 RepID=UPI00141E1F41|nr:PLP-dependent decarboxylase [Burkholderia sp. Cy-637]NIF92961.1 PLP-dependent decarboxylase [Burkholderia sp. Cy-637]